MKDARGRTINYLRISLTDLCNFRCLYCMPPEGLLKIPRSEMLRFEEILSIVHLMVERFGITKVRVTGGEPLVRRGVIGFLGGLCRIPGLHDVALTTNGYRLETMSDTIREQGVNRLNISLDSLRRDRFIEITRVDGLDQVLRGIEAARSAGFSPIKLNVVGMQENLDEATSFIAFGLEKGLEVRFIERMPFEADQRGSYISNREVKGKIEEVYRLAPHPDGSDPHSPAVRYRVDGTGATCGFISPVSEPFCSTCNRVRLRGDGKLLPCLQGITQYDLKPLIRPVFQAEELAEVIRHLVGTDPKENGCGEARHPMSQIGG